MYDHNFNILVKRLTTTCFIVLLSALFLFINSPSALAVGLGISPSKLYLEPTSGSGTVSTRLTVVNTESTTTRYRVYVQDTDFRDCFDIEPSEFMLQPGTTTSVDIRYRPSNELPSSERAYICVVTLPVDAEQGSLRIGAGIRVPILFND